MCSVLFNTSSNIDDVLLRLLPNKYNDAFAMSQSLSITEDISIGISIHIGYDYAATLAPHTYFTAHNVK